MSDLRLEYLDPRDLADNPANWRKHPSSQTKALKDVVAEVGFAGALLYNEATGRLIDGHARKALFKGKKVPVLIGSWTEEQERKILATLDPLSAMAQPDQDKLLELLQSVEFSSKAVNDLLEALANGERLPLAPLAGLTEPDDVPDVAEEPYVKRGDIYQLGEHRLMCGDATSKGDHASLLDGAQIDLVLTDPPYGVGVEYGEFQDTPTNVLALIKGFLPLCLCWPVTLITSGAQMLWDYPRPAWLLGWVHPAGMGLNRWGFTFLHPVLAYGPDPYLAHGLGSRPDTLILAAGREGIAGHPTPKPVAVWEWLIERGSIKAGDHILDPFLGSGTTLIACERLGRICYGMEIEPRYVQVSIERWQNYTGKKAVNLEHA